MIKKKKKEKRTKNKPPATNAGRNKANILFKVW
jgi:hypothetical protein